MCVCVCVNRGKKIIKHLLRTHSYLAVCAGFYCALLLTVYKKEIQILVNLFLTCVAKRNFIESNWKTIESKCTFHQMGDQNLFFFLIFNSLTWQRERDINLSFRLLMHSLADSCALTGDQTLHLGKWRGRSNQPSSPVRAKFLIFIVSLFQLRQWNWTDTFHFEFIIKFTSCYCYPNTGEKSLISRSFHLILIENKPMQI